MRRLTSVLLLVLVSAAFAAPGKTGFSGTYAIKGKNPTARGSYEGTLTIVPRGEVYDVHWAIGNAQFKGIGVSAGETLAVAYRGGDRSWVGVMNYRLKQDGSLEGRWAVTGGSPKAGSEIATRK